MAALVTLQGLPVVDLRLFLWRTGVWSADVSVDSEDELRGRVKLEGGGAFSLSGTVKRGGPQAGAGVYRVVGGAGGLGKDAEARAYNQTSANIVLQDLLRGAGEELSASSDPTVLSIVLDAWSTARRPTGGMVSMLVDRLNASWRVLPDGRVWVGREAWSPASPSDALVVQVDPRLDSVRAIFSHEEPLVTPGSTWLGRKVSHLELKVSPDEGGTLDTGVWFE
jgi:hypothetical protein